MVKAKYRVVREAMANDLRGHESRVANVRVKGGVAMYNNVLYLSVGRVRLSRYEGERSVSRVVRSDTVLEVLEVVAEEQK